VWDEEVSKESISISLRDFRIYNKVDEDDLDALLDGFDAGDQKKKTDSFAFNQK